MSEKTLFCNAIIYLYLRMRSTIGHRCSKCSPIAKISQPV